MNETEYRSIWPEWQIQKRLFTGEFCSTYLAVSQNDDAPDSKMIQIVSIPPDTPETAQRRAQAMAQLQSMGVDSEQLHAYYGRLRQELGREIGRYRTLQTDGMAPILKAGFEDAGDGIGWTAYILTELNMPLSYYRHRHITGAEEALRCGRDLCHALASLERENAVHGELNDTTVVRTSEGAFEMTAYAYRRVLEKAGQVLYPQRLTDFDAPEVASERRYSMAADLYSVGMLMGFLLCGGELPDDTRLSQAFDTNRRLVALIRKAINPRISERFATAAEMLAALNEPGLGTDESERFAEPEAERFAPAVTPADTAAAAAAPILAPDLPPEEPKGFWGKLKAILQPMEIPSDEDLPETDEPVPVPEFSLRRKPTAQQFEQPPEDAGVDEWAGAWEATGDVPLAPPELAQPAAEAPMPLDDQPSAPREEEEDTTGQEIGALVATMIEENGIGDGLKAQAAAEPEEVSETPQEPAQPEEEIPWGDDVAEPAEEPGAETEAAEETPEVVPAEAAPAGEPETAEQEAPAEETTAEEAPAGKASAEGTDDGTEEPEETAEDGGEQPFEPERPLVGAVTASLPSDIDLNLLATLPEAEEGQTEPEPEQPKPADPLNGPSVFDDEELQKIIRETHEEEANGAAYTPSYRPEDEFYAKVDGENPPTQKKRSPLPLILIIVAAALAIAAVLYFVKPWQYLGIGTKPAQDGGETAQTQEQTQVQSGNDDASSGGTGDDASSGTQSGNTGSTAPADGDFLLPSDTVELTLEDLEGFSEYDSYMALNEIYARRGYIFTTNTLQEYFSGKSWYHGTTDSSIEVYNAMTELEHKNIETIMEYQRIMGYRDDE